MTSIVRREVCFDSGGGSVSSIAHIGRGDGKGVREGGRREGGRGDY